MDAGRMKIMLGATEQRAVYETRLQHMWNNVDTSKAYHTRCNRAVRVVSPGEWNMEAGPDFLNARLVIDGRTAVGSVEIHQRSSDWFKHKHHLDSRYSGVLLHLVEDDDVIGVRAESLPPVMTFRDISQTGVDFERFKAGRCSMFFSQLPDEGVSSFLCAAGAHRFRAKSGDMLNDAMSGGIRRACLKTIFKAFGYKNNQEAFLSVFERFILYPESARQHSCAAILWGESGLLPDPSAVELDAAMKKNIQELWKEWATLRQDSSPPPIWRRSGVRPWNSPERRLAALAGLLLRSNGDPLGYFADLARTTGNPDSLQSELLKNLEIRDDLWDCRFSFTAGTGKPVAVSGRDFALELAVNVILPALHVLGTIDRENFPGLADMAMLAWMKLPATQDNRITRLAMAQWFAHRDMAAPLSTAASRQGIIHLYNEYCRACSKDCHSCLFYNSI